MKPTRSVEKKYDTVSPLNVFQTLTHKVRISRKVGTAYASTGMNISSPDPRDDDVSDAVAVH